MAKFHNFRNSDMLSNRMYKFSGARYVHNKRSEIAAEEIRSDIYIMRYKCEGHINENM